MSASHILEFMNTRRSVMARHMVEPGPDAAALEQILTIGSRVPDHGKLAPWRFVVLQGADREALGAVAEAAFLARNGDGEASLQSAAAQQFLRAPCVIAVLACPVDHPKIPRSEQILSAGAVCMNLLMAAQAMGFAAQWLTGAAAYEPAVLARLGGQAGDEIAGFMYFGTAAEAPSERPRPALSEIVQFGLPEAAH